MAVSHLLMWSQVEDLLGGFQFLSVVSETVICILKPLFCMKLGLFFSHKLLWVGLLDETASINAPWWAMQSTFQSDCHVTIPLSRRSILIAPYPRYPLIFDVEGQLIEVLVCISLILSILVMRFCHFDVFAEASTFLLIEEEASLFSYCFENSLRILLTSHVSELQLFSLRLWLGWSWVLMLTFCCFSRLTASSFLPSEGTVSCLSPVPQAVLCFSGSVYTALGEFNHLEGSHS
jgi:hypothetical protein